MNKKLPPLFYELSEIPGVRIIKSGMGYKFRIKGCTRWQYFMYVDCGIVKGYGKYVTEWQFKKQTDISHNLDKVLDDPRLPIEVQDIILFNLKLFTNQIGDLDE